MKIRSTAVFVASLLLIGHQAFGADETSPAVRMWSVSLGVGGGIGLASRGVGNLMRAAGFDDLEDCMFWCTGKPRPTPRTDQGGRSGQIVVRRRLGPTTQLRAMVSYTTLGETTGYRIGSLDTLGGYLILRQSVSACALQVGVGRRDDLGLYLVGGPSVFRVMLKEPDLPGGPTMTATSVGAIAALGFMFPLGLHPRLFLDAQAQCCLVAPVNMGPTSTPLVGELPRTRVNFTHGVASIGLGVRL
jgi:hypothetical protein